MNASNFVNRTGVFGKRRCLGNRPNGKPLYDYEKDVDISVYGDEDSARPIDGLIARQG